MRLISYVAWACCCLTITASVAALCFGLVEETQRTALAGMILGLGIIAALGALAVAKRPGILTGWLLLTFALSAALGSLCYVLAWHLSSDMPTLWGRAAAGSALILWSLPYSALLMLCLTAPDGTLLSRRWRLAVSGIAAMVVFWAFASIYSAAAVEDLRGLLTDSGLLGGNEATDVLADAAWLLAMLVMGAVLLAAAVALRLRYRRSEGEERQRLKWVVSGLVVAVALHLLEVKEVETQPLGVFQDLTSAAALLAISIGFGAALFRYRLWDIDIVIRRSLVYGTLWLAIAGLYFVAAVMLGLAASSTMPVWSAVALTVLATLVFQPTRHWLEAAADRWVFGRREQPLKVVHDFGETLGGVNQASDIAGQLARVAITAAPLTWMRVEAAGSTASEVGRCREGPVVEIALVCGHERLGNLQCQPVAGYQLSEEERSALAALAAQAAVAISRAQLASRIVRAQEMERRRIERNIHDGAQQELVALVARLGLARSQNGTIDHARLLDDLREEVRLILGNLRELAQGVHPSVLTDGGLAVAVEDRCAHLTIPVRLEIIPAIRTTRFGEDVEATAYFMVAEGLTNLMRHSCATSAHVRVSLEDSHLLLEVVDDGCGFQTGELRAGGGLQGLSDRFLALGGEIEVTSQPGQGTSLRGRLPLRIATPA